MEWESDASELKAAGAELLPDGRSGLRIHGWVIESRKGSILTSLQLEKWEELQTSHLPEMVFGDNSLVLKHVNTGTKIHFNAFDALVGWKHTALPPVEVPAAAKWKFRSKPLQQVVLDYDYTFTTPYNGSETVERNAEKGYPSDCAAYSDPSIISERLPIIMQKAQKLSIEIPCKH
ncbi:hypothetical protein RND71_000341 [Anisodus tanguticus]|uniref:TIP41-like protein n=1 Tax=Anisodus tanguticus TaxID=243964 RepID=A0AAE1SX61_9SOLA|nr:hypothetical protein RND71_000341 [Anisodus tanguticus]